MGVVAAAAVLLVTLGLLVGAQRARATAQTAADLAALAAASDLADPLARRSPSTACAAAGAVAARNGARLVGCTADGTGVVTVVATRQVAGVGVAHATARAGPASLRTGPASVRGTR